MEYTRSKVKTSLNRPAVTTPGRINGPLKKSGQPVGIPEEEDPEQLKRRRARNTNPDRFKTVKRQFPTDKTHKQRRGSSFVMPPSQRDDKLDAKKEAIKRRLRRKRTIPND